MHKGITENGIEKRKIPLKKWIEGMKVIILIQINQEMINSLIEEFAQTYKDY